MYGFTIVFLLLLFHLHLFGCVFFFCSFLEVFYLIHKKVHTNQLFGYFCLFELYRYGQSKSSRISYLILSMCVNEQKKVIPIAYSWNDFSQFWWSFFNIFKFWIDIKVNFVYGNFFFKWPYCRVWNPDIRIEEISCGIFF